MATCASPACKRTCACQDGRCYMSWLPPPTGDKDGWITVAFLYSVSINTDYAL